MRKPFSLPLFPPFHFLLSSTRFLLRHMDKNRTSLAWDNGTKKDNGRTGLLPWRVRTVGWHRVCHGFCHCGQSGIGVWLFSRLGIRISLVMPLCLVGFASVRQGWACGRTGMGSAGADSSRVTGDDVISLRRDGSTCRLGLGTGSTGWARKDGVGSVCILIITRISRSDQASW
jgi:hypothetical protein